MLIVGGDYHPRWQQVAWLDLETGETGERKLVNGGGEAERWYRQLPSPALIGMEATGNSQWFVEMLQQLFHRDMINREILPWQVLNHELATKAAVLTHPLGELSLNNAFALIVGNPAGNTIKAGQKAVGGV